MQRRRAEIGADAQWHEVFARALSHKDKAFECDSVAIAIRKERAREIAYQLRTVAFSATGPTKDSILTLASKLEAES